MDKLIKWNYVYYDLKCTNHRAFVVWKSQKSRDFTGSVTKREYCYLKRDKFSDDDKLQQIQRNIVSHVCEITQNISIIKYHYPTHKSEQIQVDVKEEIFNDVKINSKSTNIFRRQLPNNYLNFHFIFFWNKVLWQSNVSMQDIHTSQQVCWQVHVCYKTTKNQFFIRAMFEGNKFRRRKPLPWNVIVSPHSSFKYYNFNNIRGKS